MSLRVDGSGEVAKVVRVWQKMLIKAGVKAAEEEQDLFLMTML
jgi:hypothetical protein